MPTRLQSDSSPTPDRKTHKRTHGVDHNCTEIRKTDVDVVEGDEGTPLGHEGDARGGSARVGGGEMEAQWTSDGGIEVAPRLVHDNNKVEATVRAASATAPHSAVWLAALRGVLAQVGLKRVEHAGELRGGVVSMCPVFRQSTMLKSVKDSDVFTVLKEVT